MGATGQQPKSKAASLVLPPAQSWRSLLLLAGYRCAIALLLTATYYSGRAEAFFGGEVLSPLFQIACLSYLLLGLFTAFPVILRRPSLRLQLYAHALLDVGGLTLLVYAAGGVTTGIGLLLIAPVAGLGMLLSRRIGVLVGALATLALLGEEGYRYLRADLAPPSFIQTGMLGLVYFFAALVANTLSARATASEALAVRSKIALDNLAQVNERIIAHIRNGVLVVDTDGDIRLLNQAARELLDVRTDVRGRKLAAEIPSLGSSLEAWQARHQSKSEPVSFEVDDRVLLAHFNHLGAENDSHVLIFIEDASRIGEQAQQMKLAALGRLTASIAHEIRNPLGAISHAGQLLAENLPPRAQDHRLLDIIRRHTTRINIIIEEMLGLSRRDGAVPQNLRLRPWLEELVMEYYDAKSAQMPRIDCEMVSSAIEVRADPGQLRQILHNILDNALTHSGLPPEHLVIQMSAAKLAESGRVQLDIYDNGRGIPPEIASEIFEPFYTTTHRGTGLGLYIARELCECNHARLGLVHGSTLGTCFRISFADPAEWLADNATEQRAQRLSA